MKKAIIITSAIEVNNDYPLTYSSVRSHFSSEERFRQTVATIAAFDQAGDSDTVIYLIDVSENYALYSVLLGYQPNLRYIGVKEHMPEIWQDVTTHKNKSFCEQTIIYNFLKKFEHELNEFDIFVKFSGRYLIDGSFDIQIFNQQPSAFYFKHPMKFEWNDNWGYDLVDRRSIQGDNHLYQYCSVIYAWSKEYMEQYKNISRVIIEFCSHPAGMIYDVETLLYFYTREYQDQIIEVPWTIYGWDGTSGRFLRY